MGLNPHIRLSYNRTQLVMLDVMLAMLPMLVVAVIAYGTLALKQVGIAVGFALLTELIFSGLFLKRFKSILDGSAVVTAMLLAFVVSPITPWYILAFGSSSAIIFGKILWGGIGKNRFNPALVGREFMSVFFAGTMTSAQIWKTQDLVWIDSVDLFSGSFSFISRQLNELTFKTSGAMGEYSMLAIALGGIYLLIRNRISWHIPFGVLSCFTLVAWLNPDTNMTFSPSGVLLGTIFMATDMPSSPTTPKGKLYYGCMLGVVAAIFIIAGVRYEYMSYSILLLNAFSQHISLVFKPSVWGLSEDWKVTAEQAWLLTLAIAASMLAIISINYYGLEIYVIYLYILYTTIKFNFSFTKTINHAI